jgi:hypothetical protein
MLDLEEEGTSFEMRVGNVWEEGLREGDNTLFILMVLVRRKQLS